MSALQCPKRLYLEVHNPERVEIGAALQSRFDVGHRVGEVARSLYPGGRLIGHERDPGAALREAESALAVTGDLVLFEPAFRHGGVLVRADLLFRRGGRYRLVEVKATTEVKNYHLQDVAIQAWVIEGAGYPLESVSVMHVDNTFVYPGGGDYRGLLKTVDVSDEIAGLRGDAPALALRCEEILSGPTPEIATGRHCTTPYACPLLAWCNRDAPEYPLSILGKSWRLREHLSAQGYRDLRDVPQTAIEGRLPRRIWHATVTGETFVDAIAAKHFTDLPYPRYFLDFETIQFAVPVWPGTRPYEQLPFQWSCHIEHRDGRIEHREFLDTDGQVPMRACTVKLIEALGREGPVFMYTGFERRVLREAVAREPDLAPALDAAIGRLIDLHPIVVDHYYHPAQKGSWSIKAVLPTIAPTLDHANLGNVANGGDAQLAYLELIDAKTTGERKVELEDALRRYCERDTDGMLHIVARLAGMRDRSCPSAVGGR